MFQLFFNSLLKWKKEFYNIIMLFKKCIIVINIIPYLAGTFNFSVTIKDIFKKTLL